MIEQRTKQSQAPDEKSEIVVGVDGTAASNAAVDYAVAVALATGRPLHLVHATPQLGPFPPLAVLAGDEVFDSGRSLLGRATARARLAAPGHDIRDTLSLAPRKAELARVARDAAMLVLGRRDEADQHRFPTGSTAASLAPVLDCPVRVVPTDWHSRPHSDDVVVGVKRHEGGGALIARGLELAAETGGTLVLAHAWFVPTGYQGILSPAEIEARNAHAAAALEHAAGALRASWPEVPVRAIVQVGKPDQVLTELALDAALVLVGRPEHTHVFHRLGRTARAMLQSSAAPIEIGPRVLEPDGDPLVDAVIEQDGALLR